MIPTITLDNFTEHLWNYTMSLYGDEIEANRANCPYDLDDLSEEHSMKQLTTWFMFIRTNPRTGMTIVEEFSRRFVKDPELAKMLLRARKAFYGTFTVLAKIKDSVDPAGKDQNNGEYGIILVGAPEDDTYRIIVTDKTYALYAVGTQFMGIIHPWLGNGTHKTCGILNARFPPDDDLELKESKNVMSMLNPETIENLIKYSKKSKARMKKRDESHIIGKEQTLSVILSRFTLMWVDGMSKILNVRTEKMNKGKKIETISTFLTSDKLRDVIQSLSRTERKCLIYVIKKKGIVSYSSLQKHFGKDESIDMWEEYDRPKSTIGELRKRGILFVGILEYGDRHKHVIIPADVLACIYRIWPSLSKP